MRKCALSSFLGGRIRNAPRNLCNNSRIVCTAAFHHFLSHSSRCVCVRTNNEHKFKANINKIVNIFCTVPRPQQAGVAASRVHTPQQLNLRGRRTTNKTMKEKVMTVTVRYPRNG